MKYILPSLIFFALLSNYKMTAQSTQDLFSIPGLSFVIDIYDDTGQFTDGSLFYMGDTIHQDTLYLKYENKRRNPIYLYIDGYKVYQKYMTAGSKTLLFDFDLEIGDSISVYENHDYVLESKGTMQLEDGLDRIAMNFTHSLYPNWKIKTIEGIGYQKHGLFTFMYYSTLLQCITTDNSQIYLNEDFSSEACEQRSCPGIQTSFVMDGNQENISFNHTSYNFDSISLTFGDGIYFDDFKETYNYLEEGCYKIELEVFNECGESAYDYDYYNYCVDPKWQKQSDLLLNSIQFMDENLGFGRSWKKAYKTIDGGSNWIELPLPADDQSYNLYSIYFSTEQRGVIITDSEEEQLRVIVTKDGGASWKGILTDNTNYGLRDAVMLDNGDIFAISTRYIYKTNVNTMNWTKLDGPLGWQIGDFQLTENNVLILAQMKLGTYDFPSYLYISSDNGNNWQEIDMTFDEGISSVFFFNALHGFVGMEGDLYETTDGGTSWNNVLSLKEGGKISNIKFENEDIGVLVVNNRLFRTTNGGLTWQVEYCNNDEFIYDLVQADSYFYAALKNGLYERKLNPDFDCNDLNSSIQLDELDIQISPNPAQSFLHIINGKEGNYKVKIVNLNGELIRKSTINNNESLDISNLTNGLYMLSVEHKGIQKTIKWIKI